MTNAITSFTGEHEWLSNFFMRPMLYRNLRWRSAEHAYQAMKTTDLQAQERIRLEAPHARDAKRMGYHVVLRPLWDTRRRPFMKSIIDHKFSVGSELARWLIETGDAILVHGNDHGDRYWGSVDGEGEDQLGLILTDRRAVLQNTKL